MTHGDDNGLILPPAAAPVQVVVIPVAQQKEGVLDKANELLGRLKAAGWRAEVDASDQSPGWKFSQHEMRGVPVRVEIGPRDIENGSCVLVRRDTADKLTVPLDALETAVGEQLDALRKNLYDRALENRQNRTRLCADYAALERAVSGQAGFYHAAWCGDRACEEKLKEELDISSRCIPFEQTEVSDRCVVCGRPAVSTVVWGKSY